MTRLRTVFMGTPDFSVPCLSKLMEISEVVAVVTQPDKPRGRGKKLVPSPVKAYAEAHGIPVYQPTKIKSGDFVPVLESLAPDLMVVVAFGQILSQRILDIPRLGCVNVHASLLPRYRGAAPMQRCLMAGETVTGVTTMRMDAGLDTGDMLEWAELAIPQEMSFGELHDALSAMGAELLVSTVRGLAEGTIQPVQQDDMLSNYAAMLTKETGAIDWNRPAEEIHNLVRALDPLPGAYATLAGDPYKIWKTRVVAENEKTCESGKAPGDVLALTKEGLLIATGCGAIEILELQAPGKKRMRAADYVRGHARQFAAVLDA